MSLIAIQGIRGSYSEEAVEKMFGAEAQIFECLDFEQTFSAVLQGEVDYAVVPLKNKIVGEIKSATAALSKTDLKILEEVALKIQHVLIGAKSAKFSKLQTICSHEEALKQCRNFLSKHANLQISIGSDTASCVKKVIEEDNAKKAAIGSRRAAEIYGGKILRENISDDTKNVTTFYLIGN